MWRITRRFCSGAWNQELEEWKSRHLFVSRNDESTFDENVPTNKGCLHIITILLTFYKLPFFRKSCGSITLSGEGISQETSQCGCQMTDIAGILTKVCFRAPAPHLDYFQDDEARLEFHKTFPLIDLKYTNVSEGHVLTGYYDTEDLRLGVMLGVWKPLNPTQVKSSIPFSNKPIAKHQLYIIL